MKKGRFDKIIKEKLESHISKEKPSKKEKDRMIRALTRFNRNDEKK